MQQLTVRQDIYVPKPIPDEHEFNVYQTMAETAVNSKFYLSNYKDKAAVMMIMLAARELGIPPMQALNGGIHIIQGKVEISVRMMSALIRKAGHEIKIKEFTSSKCTIEGIRKDTGESLEVSFTVAEAQAAGLVKPGGGWTKWPADMCFARALSRLARQLFSDVIGIGYVEGEISQKDIKDSDVEIVAPKEIEINYVEEYKNSLGSKYDKQADFYMKKVAKHFEISVNEAAKMLLNDKDHVEKFLAWLKENGDKI